MNILLTINSAFLKQAVVLMQSVLDNNKQSHICFYIVHCDLDEKEIELLNSYASSKSVGLRIIYQDPSVFEGFRIAGPFPYEVYFRILAHRVTPQSVKRILYLDTDIICNGDLSELYDLDFNDNFLIACAQKEEYAVNKKEFLENFDDISAARGKYFNDGVLLINCEKFRSTNIDLDDYRAAANKMVSNYVFDQGLLNYMFAKQTRLISSVRFNYRYGSYYLKALGDVKQIPRPKPAIIHFAGEVCPYKPWDFLLTEQEIKKYSVPAPKIKKAPYFIVNKDINELTSIWWSYAEKTPVYGDLLIEMKAKKEWYKRGISGYLKKLAVCEGDCEPLNCSSSSRR